MPIRIALSLLFLLTSTAFAAGPWLKLGAERPVSAPVTSSAPDGQWPGGVASDGENFLVVWVDARGAEPIWAGGWVPSTSIFSARLSSSGELVDPLGVRLGVGTVADVAWAASARSYLVVWASGEGVVGRTAGADGVPRGDRKIYRHGLLPNALNVASNGKNFLVLLQKGRQGNQVEALLLDGQGNLIHSFALEQSFPESFFSLASLASDGNDFLVSSVSPQAEGIRLIRINGADGSVSNLSMLTQARWTGPVVWTGQDYFLTWMNPGLKGMFVSSEGNPTSEILEIGGEVTAWRASSTGDGTALLMWNQNDGVLGRRVSRIGVDRLFTVIEPRVREIVADVAATDSRHLLITNLGPFPMVPDFTAQYDVAGHLLDPEGAHQEEPLIVSNSVVRQDEIDAAVIGGSAWAVWEERGSNSWIAGASLGDSHYRMLVQSETDARFPAIASNGDSGLLVWLEGVGQDREVKAVRLSRDGAWLDPAPIRIAQVLTAWGYDHPSKVAVAWTGELYLVIWSSDWKPRLRLARITREGVLLDREGITVDTERPDLHQLYPKIVMGEDSALLVWQRGTRHYCSFTWCFEPTAHIVGLRINRNGEPLDSQPFRISREGVLGFRPDVAWNGTTFLVVWNSWSEPIVPGARVAVSGSVTLVAPFFHEASDEVRVTNHGSRFVAVWSGFGFPSGVRVRMTDELGNPMGDPMLVTSQNTKNADPHVLSTGRDMFVFYQRIAPEMTGVPRLFYRSLFETTRSRMVRR